MFNKIVKFKYKLIFCLLRDAYEEKARRMSCENDNCESDNCKNDINKEDDYLNTYQVCVYFLLFNFNDRFFKKNLNKKFKSKYRQKYSNHVKKNKFKKIFTS